MPQDATPRQIDPNSISDIAATMIVPADPPQEKADEPVAPTGEKADQPDQETPGTEGQEGEPEGEQPEGEEGTEGDDATDDDDGDEGQEHPELVELADDTTFSVTVDGKETEVTLADLKRAYSGEGAIAKRLQEATEAKRTFEAQQQQVKQELDQGREKLVRAFQTFEALMFQPRVPKPDAAMQQSNPQQYLLQMERYREDQAAINAKRAQVSSAMQQYEAQQEREVEQLRVENAQKLVEVLPDLKDPEKGKELRQSILDAAAHYGFHPSEVAQAYDYRIFQMAADAAAYRKLVSQQKAEPQKVVPKTKVLRPGTAKAKQQTVKARQVAATYQKARQTGSVEDVAATMIVPNR